MSQNPSRERPLLAVLIDADNVPAKHAGAILREITSIGEPALRRVYGDWASARLKPWNDQLLSLGLVAVQETANTKGKNASDIGLVIDAMDILHGGRFDGFVLVSSDSDFTALANRLRENGLMVIGIGEKKTPEALRNVVNRFIFIENLEDSPENTPREGAEKSEKALPLIKAAMKKMEPVDDWYSLGHLGNIIIAAHTDFDTRTYGHSKLSQLVQAIPMLEYRKNNNGQVRLKP
ncbi:NYN domain-containing protein [Sulfitobacter sp. F26169L]|uniref:NYN domain-containing protein n=1 Tax=Sulfitobacter sp. F26169L TaxID=2996015 RepID=UPI00226091F0|nr:NYN domain-containing protein [Sulfitobacter sp. F26169L]MCX7566082.1 NYN domain-containing protein [Sulfitobacter sp. F26169L]